jgi:hypothetical protein
MDGWMDGCMYGNIWEYMEIYENNEQKWAEYLAFMLIQPYCYSSHPRSTSSWESQNSG